MADSKDNSNGVTSTTTSTTVVTSSSPPPVTQVASQVNTVTPIQTTLPQVQVIHQPVTPSTYIQQLYNQQLMVQAMQASGINPQQISLAAVQGRAATVSQGIGAKSPSVSQAAQPNTSESGPVKLTTSTVHASAHSTVVTDTTSASTPVTKTNFITTARAGTPLQHTATPMVAGKPVLQRQPQPLVIGQLGVLSTPQSSIGQANQNNKGNGSVTPTSQTCSAAILTAPQITLSSQGQLVTNTGQILTTQPSQGAVITSQAVLSHLQAMATLQHNLPLAQTFSQSPTLLSSQPLYIRAAMPIQAQQAQTLVGSMQAVTAATGMKNKQTVELPATLQVRPAVAVPLGKQNAGSQTSKSMANMVSRVKSRTLPKVNPLQPATVGKVIAKPVQQLTPIAPTPSVQQVKVEPLKEEESKVRVTATVVPETQCTSTVTTDVESPSADSVTDQAVPVNCSADGHTEEVNTNGGSDQFESNSPEQIQDVKVEEPMEVDKKVDLSTVSSDGKQRAIVKPQCVLKQVLTHIIEGFVIQEGPEPFPVQRSSILTADVLQKASHIQARSTEESRRTEEEDCSDGQKDADMESDSQPESLTALDKESDIPPTLKCEFCGKVDLASKFRRSKRFCSMACAKRYNVGCSRRLGLFKPKTQNPDASTSGTSSGKVKKKKHSMKKSVRRGLAGRLNTSPISQKIAEENSEQSQPSEASQESNETGHDSQDFPMDLQWEYLSKHGSARHKQAHVEQPDTEDQTSTSAPSSSGVDEDNTSMSEPMPSPPELIPEVVPAQRNPNPARWTVEEVYEFIHSMQGCAPYAEVFRSQEIDGQALLLLKEDHLMSTMNMKLGPALKICARINSLKEECS